MVIPANLFVMIDIILPEPADTLREAYRALIAEIDTKMARLVQDRFIGRLRCQAGCDSCCIRFSVLPIEAAFIATVVPRSLPLPNEGGDRCCFLREGMCTIYMYRPVLCRTQGVPLGYVDEVAGTIEVSACPLNFQEDYLFEIDDLYMMDEINHKLAELNLTYCKQNDIAPDVSIALEMLACKEEGRRSADP